MRYYHTLLNSLGPQHWWPAGSPFEVIVGAILTQNTAWTNVEQAIANLRRERLLTPAALHRASLARLEALVRPSGYFRQKAEKLKAFTRYLFESYGGSLEKMLATPTARLRQELLAIRGIGPETADSILLYAGNHPVFVVDAYTRRVLTRHRLGPPAAGGHDHAGYEALRAWFEAHLPRDAQLYNEFHALLVQAGKHFCRPQTAFCFDCPLARLLPAGSELRAAAAAGRPYSFPAADGEVRR